MAIKKIMVTGSSGTIGTGLCENLLEKGYDIVGVDYKKNKWNNEVDKITINCDLRDKKQIDNLPNDVDIIIHLAANARVYELVVDTSLAQDNFNTTFNTLEFARKNNIKRFMFASSRETYGNSVKEVHSEKDVKIELCESPYTASKIGGEALVYAYNKCYEMDYVVIRFSNVYGRYDDSDRVVPLFIRQTVAGEDLTVFGKEKFLDFTHINDAVDGVVLAIEKFEDSKNDTFNIALGKGESIVDVAKKIQSILNVNNKIIIKDNRPGEVVRYVADITKAKEKLGFDPKIGIDEGLRLSIKWFKDNLVE